MAYTKLIPRQTSGAQVEEISGGDRREAYRLSIPAGLADKYRLSQLDDYPQLKRSRFPWRFPLSLSLSAQASSDSIPGTWGFGLWNDPFGLSLGFGGNALRLPTLPNAAWFFGASKENYLSFRPERSDATQSKGTLQEALRLHSTQREIAANGFLAQIFRSPRFHPLLIPAGLALPFSRKRTRYLLGKIIEEDGIQLWGEKASSPETQQQAVGLQRVDPTQWHRYKLHWRENGVSFEVDDVQVFESRVSPNPPLGLVIWIDNQYAAFTPEGKIGFGVLENPEPAWLEIKDIDIA
ncbi:MAG TPA: hypothetical protein VK206_03705 [Anaerolineales bacterium]|nr:hypothetical protein [Anaerolineales bacterium]